MSDFREILGRAQTDYDFYLAMLRDPEKAISSYSLSKAESAVLTTDRTALWRFITSIEGRPGQILGSYTDDIPPGEGPPPEGHLPKARRLRGRRLRAHRLAKARRPPVKARRLPAKAHHRLAKARPVKARRLRPSAS